MWSSLFFLLKGIRIGIFLGKENLWKLNIFPSLSQKYIFHDKYPKTKQFVHFGIFYEYTRWLLFSDDVIVSKELYGQKAKTFIIRNDLKSDNIGPKK